MYFLKTLIHWFIIWPRSIDTDFAHATLSAQLNFTHAIFQKSMLIGFTHGKGAEHYC